MAAPSVAAALAKRELGMTETSWASLLEGGTGIVVIGLWFGRPLSRSIVQAAVNDLVNQLPYLNSRICTGEKNKLFFELRKTVPTVTEEVNPFVSEGGGGEEPKEAWLKIVDLESNKLFPSTKEDGGSPVLQVVSYKDLPNNSSLVVLRLHSSAFDMPSLGLVLRAFMTSLRQTVEEAEEKGRNIQELLQNFHLKNESLLKFSYHPSLEELMPKADKSLLSMGVNMVGYGVAASKQRHIPFSDSKSKERHSRIIRASLSREATDRLVQACRRNSSDLFGAMNSALLKAVADYKRVGKTKELYGAAVFLDCRTQLRPPLPQDAVGFYNSPMLALTQVSQSVNGSSPFWKMASESTKSFNDAIKNQKHFKDLKDLNYLTTTAIKHPGVTPEGSLRTATISLFHDPVVLNIPKDAAEYLQLKDHVEFCSCHGVGPGLVMYSFLNDGAINFSFGYPSPLFSREQMQTIVDSTMKYLIES